jgi:hypothetical protein
MKDSQITAEELKRLFNENPVRPEGATSIYTVKWHLVSDSFNNFGSAFGGSPTPTRLLKSKTFISKDKADSFSKNLKEAFNTLEYTVEGMVWVEEGWLE